MFAARNMLRRAAAPFVTRDAGTGYLMLNGARFRFAGANCGNDFGFVSASNGNNYGGTEYSGYYLTTHSQADAVLDSAEAMNTTVLRLLCVVATSYGSPTEITLEPSVGTFNEDALEPLDYALQQCNIRGMKLIVPLIDMYGSLPWLVTNTGGGANTNFWTRTATIDAYKARIDAVLDHVNVYTGVALKDDPAILCWETGNELVYGVTDAQLRAWSADISAYIKTTKGAQQLLMAGQYGTWDDATYMGDENMDIYGDHGYTGHTPASMATQAAMCHGYGKSFVAGAFDWTGGSHSFDQYVDNFDDGDADGDAFWDLLAPLTSWSDGYTVHYPGDNASMRTRAMILADHNAQMTGITPKTFLSDTFTGSNGTALGSHTGETGATWAKQEEWTGTCTIQNNRLYSTTTEAHYYASGVPASSDYTVTASIYIVSNATTCFAGVIARAWSEIDYGYEAYLYNSGTPTLYLTYNHTSGETNLDSTVITAPAVGSTHTLALTVEGTSLAVYWDDVLKIGPYTHTGIYNAGRAGVIQGGSGMSSTAGYHIDSVTATD